MLNQHLAKIRKHAWEILDHSENSDDKDYDWLFAEMAWTWALTHLRAAVEISHFSVSSLPRMVCFLMEWEKYCECNTDPDLFTYDINLKWNNNPLTYQSYIDNYKSDDSSNSKLNDLTRKIEEVKSNYDFEENTKYLSKPRTPYFDQIKKFNEYNAHWNTEALRCIYSSVHKMSWPLYPYRDAVNDLREIIDLYRAFYTSLQIPCEIHCI